MRILAFVCASFILFPALAAANLDADFAACRRKIIQIGSDPKSPADQYCLGLSHAFALNHPKNQAEAAKWFRKAADQNHAGAQATLGYMYERGYGLKADAAEAAKWYRKSAEQGDANGQFRLGRAYQFGIGVPQKRQEAIRWFDKAGDQGHDQANYFANHLKQRGTYMGFRNDEEHAAVVGNKLRSVLLSIEPVGHTFHNSSERMAFLRQAGRQADRDEAYQRWSGRKLDYDDCRRANRSNCSDPGPPPN